jgi:formamidopyrimidine-DNA glycosylase
MPEIPDLEAIRAFIGERLIGVEITKAEVVIPTVIRSGAADFEAALTGNRFEDVRRHGKFLIFGLADAHLLVINAMLTGRFRYVEAAAKRAGRTCFVLTFENGWQLRYADQMVMGKVYVVPIDALAQVPMFAEMGPDALAVSEEEFRERIGTFNAAIKNVLTNHKFIAGIGNAYSDEILWEARVQPFRKRSSLSDDEVGALYRAIHKVMDRSIPIVREKFREELDYREWRDHLKVHRKGGGDRASKEEGRCPRCGSYLTEIAPNQRVTTYCRTCQK